MHSALPNIFIALSVIALWTPYREAWKVGFLLAVFSGFALGMLDVSALFTIFVYGALWMAYAQMPSQSRFWAILIFAGLIQLRFFCRVLRSAQMDKLPPTPYSGGDGPPK